jgi:FkbM family methyltransferase
LPSARFLSLSEILDQEPVVDVVDVGANPIDGDPPYKGLLASGMARVVGFEPNPDALKVLNDSKGPNEVYLPHVIADGKRHALRFCRASGMTSLLQPNSELYQYFHGFTEWGTVLKEEIVETVRLDDVEEIHNLDYLKIDIQGAELLVFKNAKRRLSECTVIQTEVEFLPLYIDQPLFSDVERFLRSRGFIFHRFWPAARSRTIRPMLVNNDIYKGLSQIVDADAVFIRDFTRLDRLNDRALLRMALTMHDVYRSFDVVLRLLMEFDRRCGSALASRYAGDGGLLRRMSA